MTLSMHDWTLRSILYEWKEARVTLLLRPSRPPEWLLIEECRLVAEGVSELTIPQRKLWGPSASILEYGGPFDVGPDKLLRILIQSGDVVAIVASSFRIGPTPGNPEPVDLPVSSGG